MRKLIPLLFGLMCMAGVAWSAVNLNTASVDQLDAVKGVGPAKAKAIVAYREKNGPFKSVDELAKVKGFGDKSVAKLRGELSIGEAPAKK